MNPQLGEQLRIIYSSPEMMHMVVFYRQALDEQIKQTMLNAILNLADTEYGRQLLMLFQIERCIPVVEGDLASVKDLINEYQELKNTQ